MEDEEEEDAYTYLSRGQSESMHGPGSAERRGTGGGSERRDWDETADEKMASIDA